MSSSRPFSRPSSRLCARLHVMPCVSSPLLDSSFSRTAVTKLLSESRPVDVRGQGMLAPRGQTNSGQKLPKPLIISERVQARIHTEPDGGAIAIVDRLRQEVERGGAIAERQLNV